MNQLHCSIAMKPPNNSEIIGTWFRKLLPLISLLIICVVLSLLRPRFLTWENISNIIRQHAQIIIMAIGMTFVIISRGIDLSVGSMMALAGVCGTLLMTVGVPVVPAILAGCVAGLFWGLVNGFAIRAPIPLILVLPIPMLAIMVALELRRAFPVTLVLILSIYTLTIAAAILLAILLPGFVGTPLKLLCRIKVSPFIATLGTMQVFRGLVLQMTEGLTVYKNIPPSFGKLRNGNLAEIVPVGIFDSVAVYLILIAFLGIFAFLILRRTRLGRYLYFHRIPAAVIFILFIAAVAVLAIRLRGSIPLPLILILIIAALASLVLRYTRLGRYSYAIGSNVEAAYHSGIKVGIYIVLIYAVCGLLTGLAGMIHFSSLGSGVPTEGVGYELRVIAAVVIGGGSLMGGEGSVSGTIAGALFMAILLNACVHLQISDYIQQIVIGALLVLAVAFDQLWKRKLQGESQ